MSNSKYMFFYSFEVLPEEDYLYPEDFFAPVKLPIITKEKLELATA